MSKKAIKITAIVIALIFLLGIFGPFAYTFVFSMPTDDSHLEDIQQEKKLTLEDINKTELELNKAAEELRVLNEKIELSSNELKQVNEKLEAAEKLEMNMREESGKRFRIMCEKGMLSYLDIIFSSKNFTDFIDRLVIAKELAEYDRDMMNAVASVKKDIIDSKTKAEEILKEQEAALAELDEAKIQLEQKAEESKAILARLESDEEAYIKYLEQKEREEMSLREQYASNGSATVVSADGMFVWPTNTTWITSEFAPSRVNPVSGKILPHTGTDIGAQSGAPVTAAASGKVSFAGVNGGYGNCIILEHGDGISTLYAHLSSINVSSGESVAQGALIGRVGSTGNSTGPHLHFEIIIDGTPVNPMQFF